MRRLFPPKFEGRRRFQPNFEKHSEGANVTLHTQNSNGRGLHANREMVKQLPPNFAEHWEGANVILRTQNSNGRELHANKEELAAKSSYFNAMFFSGFKEAFQDYVDVPCDYKYMLNILRTIHESNTRGHLIGTRASDDLAEMYRVADMLDFPEIRNMYIHKLDSEIVLIACAALQLENREMLAKCLEKMSKAKMTRFLEMEHEIPMFCKNDVISVYKKITDTRIPNRAPKKAVSYEMAETNVLVDLTKKWHASDLVISTRNSDGRLLYANKGVLSTFSENFHKVCTSSNESEPDFPIHLDVDYMTMKIILSLLHQTGFNASSLINLDPMLLFDMYRVAKEMDIPLIKNLVSDRLSKRHVADCFEVVIKLELQNLVPQMLARMRPKEIRDWVLSTDQELIYRGNDEEITISSKATDLNLSLNDLRCIFWKLNREFAPPPQVPTAAPAEVYRDNYEPHWSYNSYYVASVMHPPTAFYY